MQEARRVDMVLDPDTEWRVDAGGQSEGSIWLADAKHRSRLAVDLNVTALNPQHGRRRFVRLRLQPRSRANCKSSSNKIPAR